jgi:hypothetical protein
VLSPLPALLAVGIASLFGRVWAGLLRLGWSLPGDLGVRIAGAALAASALWLGRFDIARRALRRPGLPRFVALALLPGYAWLGLGGLLWLRYGAVPDGHAYEAQLHAIFPGFVFSMIFGDARARSRQGCGRDRSSFAELLPARFVPFGSVVTCESVIAVRTLVPTTMDWRPRVDGHGEPSRAPRPEAAAHPDFAWR